MAQQTIAANAEKIVEVPLNQSITIGTWGGGIAKIFYESTPASIPPAFYLAQTLTNDSVNLSNFTRDQKIKITAGDNEVLYDIGTSPVIGYGSLPTIGPNDETIYSSAYGSMGGFRNVILNGDMNIWQYLTTFTGVTTDVVTADKWWSNVSGATVTYSRQAFTAGQTDVPNEPQYFLRANATVADDNWGVIQKVEDVRTLAGKTVTLSFYAKGDSTHTLRLLIRQQFGSGGSASVDLVNLTNSLASGDTWTKYTWTTTLGSMSGKTIGANSAVWVFIIIDENTTGTLDISQVQLEEGSVATQFEQRSYNVEIAMCQRYRWRNNATGNGNAYLYGAAGNALMTGPFASFPVEMRTSPTMTIVTNPTYTNCSANNVTASNTGFVERVDVTATGIYRASGGNYLAEADIP